MYKIKGIIFTLIKLGIRNIFLISVYKFNKKFKVYKFLSKIKKFDSPIIFNKIKNEINYSEFSINKNTFDADKLINGEINYFHSENFMISSPPNWFYDPYNKTILNQSNSLHWSEYKIFNSSDIKIFWDISRWRWAIIFAKAWNRTRNGIYIKVYNEWANDWCRKNPANNGLNWICGQEVSIRLINALIAWQLFDYPRKILNITETRRKFIEIHLDRVYLTRIYAEAQQNNHWITESAALFIGGIILNNDKYSNYGRNSLEKGISKLVMSDGSFSQHSINYHRFLLDIINQVELWRVRLNKEIFSNQFYFKYFKAIEWFSDFIDFKSGDAPNLGGNDGTYCFKINNSKYRNYRSTLKISINLLKKIYKELKIIDKTMMDEISLNYGGLNSNSRNIYKYYSEGGYLIIKPNKNTWGMLRLPKYKFRPSNIDPLHFDFWHEGENILIDGGTYSYNASSENLIKFHGIRSHNCVEFDNKQPLSKISRFLFLNYFKDVKDLSISNRKNKIHFISGYQCESGIHERELIYSNKGNKWIIVDRLSGFKNHAVLRWNLIGKNWKFKDNELKRKSLSLKIIINKNHELILERGFYSRFYYHKEAISILKVKVFKSPITIKTIIKI